MSQANPQRKQHIAFKYSIVSMALADPNRLSSSLGSDDGEKYLVALWDSIGDRLNPTERVPSTGLAVTTIGNEDSARLFFVRFPKPEFRNEAYYVAAVPGEADRLLFRVFGLEHSMLPATGEDLFMVVEWNGMQRFNYGPAENATLAALTSAIEQIADGERSPMATVDMPLFDNQS